MTKPTPEQMLKLAKICEPNKHWKIIGERVWECCANGDVCIDAETFEPRSRFVLGQAQLMKVVFAAAKKVDGYEFREYELTQALASKDREAILNLAVEVLL